MYYNDIKAEYENIQNDMDEILSTFPELISAINS
jgi:hypothetical protein